MWHCCEIETAQIMNARLDYSLKVCIMNASLYSPTKQREEKAMPNSGRLPSRMWRENAGCNRQVLSQGLKGTRRQSLWTKRDMIFRICSQGEYYEVQGSLHTCKNTECIKLYWCGKPWNQLKRKPGVVALNAYISPQYRQPSPHPKANINQLP